MFSASRVGVKAFRFCSPIAKFQPTIQVKKLSQSIQKVSCSSIEDFFDKAAKHLDEGDCAQSCEKLFGVTKFALRSYVSDMCKFHSLVEVPSESWNYSKYRKLCNVVDRFVKKNEKKGFLTVAWRISEHLHVHGWKLNELDFEDVKNGIEEVEEIVKKIQTLPRDREIIETIFKEIFDLDTDFAIENIHK
uniref:Uncharacterized protein n=1 Tax=Acrobeloides nanus TaxID=290746 RepID=A0A914DD39_9BILA